jgi:hypothetical protein
MKDEGGGSAHSTTARDMNSILKQSGLKEQR